MNENEKRRTYLLLVLTTVIWGIQPLCIKWLVTVWSPVTITAMRYFLIGMVLILLAVRRGEHWLPTKECRLPLLLMGLTGIGLNNVMQFTGLKLSTVTNCTLIAAASPAITVVLAAIFVRERLNFLAWIGILISFLGALLVVSHGSLAVIRRFAFNWGDILFFLAQMAWTFYSLLGLRVMRHISAALTTGWAGLSGAFLASAYGMLTGDLQLVSLSPGLWGSFLYTVILGGIMAMLFWNIGVKNAGPSITSIFQNVTPVVGMLGGMWLFHEIIGPLELAGAVAIFGGVYLTTHSGQ